MKSAVSDQKLRGGYYTPRVLADFLVKWAVQRRTDAVLEPSCGDGAFIDAIVRRYRQLPSSNGGRAGRVVAAELDRSEAAKAEIRLSAIRADLDEARVIADDFFRICEESLLPLALWDATAQRFDAVVGNPPFIRYQNFPEKHRETAFGLMKRSGLSPNKLTNAWVAFLVCGALTLSAKGRLAMVIPAELLQVSYAAEIRRFLSEFFARITIITFRGLVFPEIQQEVVLLLAERQADESVGIRTVELSGLDQLAEFDFFESLNGAVKPLDHSTEKWTKYFLPARQMDLLRLLRGHVQVRRFGEIAEVDVGVVTGDNDFFVMRPSVASSHRVRRFSRPIVSKSMHLSGLVFSEKDLRSLAGQDARTLLFSPKSVPVEQLSDSVRRYIEIGERAGVNEGYKCRIRKRWYCVPSVWVPEAFALRQIHRYPKLVINKSGATATDTVHRVRLNTHLPAKQVAAGFLNSMTFAFGEITGRSYGGGVLTFEPTEVEALPIPVQGMENLDCQWIDKALRKGDVFGVLDHSDRVLLKDGLGLSRVEIQELRSAWTRLSNRRIQRRSATNRQPEFVPEVTDSSALGFEATIQ